MLGCSNSIKELSVDATRSAGEGDISFSERHINGLSRMDFDFLRIKHTEYILTIYSTSSYTL